MVYFSLFLHAELILPSEPRQLPFLTFVSQRAHVPKGHIVLDAVHLCPKGRENNFLTFRTKLYGLGLIMYF